MLHKIYVFWDVTLCCWAVATDCLTMTRKELWFFEISGTTAPTTQCNIPEFFSNTAVKTFNLTCHINPEEKESGDSLNKMEGSTLTWMEKTKRCYLWRNSKNRTRSWSRMRRRYEKELTSGSPVEKFVWISILPIRMSLHTSHTACSMVSPALKMDTPQILLLADCFPW